VGEHTDVHIGATGGNGDSNSAHWETSRATSIGPQRNCTWRTKLPAAIGGGQTKITDKPTLAQIGSILYSDTSATRRRSQPASAPRRRAGLQSCYQVTVANGANSVDDLGVFFSSSGLPMKRVANRWRSSSAPLGEEQRIKP
jgi:hypothetical protein